MVGGMYRTIRQGEASLQYTILPQTDQIHGNEMSSVRNSEPSVSPFPKSPTKGECRICELGCLKSKQHHFGFFTLTFFVCVCLATYFLGQFGNFVSRNEFSCQSNSSITTETFVAPNNTDDDYEFHNNYTESTTTIANELNSSKSFDHNAMAADVSATSTLVPTNQTNEINHSQTTIDETTFPAFQEFESTTSLPISDDDLSLLPEDSSNNRSNGIKAPSKKIVSTQQKWKMIKMPRVTLKLRENETIPQMYMKSGIASYKKGNVTTSVLAKRLSLEGLIFRTPEGTIKPWPEKWPSNNDSEVIQHSEQQHRGNKTVKWLWLIFMVAMIVVMVFEILWTLGKWPFSSDPSSDYDSLSESE